MLYFLISLILEVLSSLFQSSQELQPGIAVQEGVLPGFQHDRPLFQGPVLSRMVAQHNIHAVFPELGDGILHLGAEIQNIAVGRILSIDCTKVEQVEADNMYQRAELDYLIYNDPEAYAELILNGDPKAYLETVTEYKRLD